LSPDETSYYADKTWVQCKSPRCLKWTLVPKGDEAVAEPDHGKSWHCHMNPDPLFSHCSIPQGPFPKSSQSKEHGLKVVYSLLPVGSLVLVKACNWPCHSKSRSQRGGVCEAGQPGLCGALPC
uniref:CW-type domain-containing protein n=1 Tax=Salmo trutta TaxID=8032 RepID=A0A674AMF5_SALTR